MKVRLSEITTGTFIGPQAEKIKVAELAEDFLREYRINERKSIDDATARWNLHLEPFFGARKAIDVSSDLISRYVDQRQHEGAKNATINREVAALKRMFRLGQQSTPAKVLRMPHFPHLRENNVRKGFLEDSQYRKLVEGQELWFRTIVECGRTYGWRISELLSMKVKQVDLMQRVIRLDPGTTKNNDGREVFMTDALYLLLGACVEGKGAEDAVFTRPNGIPVRTLRDAWEKACTAAGVGQFICVDCATPVQTGAPCQKCSGKRTKYTGLIFHDLRRTAARNLRRAGISETVIMKIGGWRTRSVFERYAIVSRGDIVDAMQKLQINQQESQISHEIGHAAQADQIDATPKSVN
ncbi:integrase [Edaphobacter lichenicola]|uniref:Integrase n=1 Tax=Tunturiibacter lichenicola TaxID=2051959 RepID=A0A852VH82_9BACT|nr:tyrosine-type recombinase/integrase [Edaphobacter lichenicola]NYF88892.1 integrase [Edaphobacter lichenicola]